MKQNIIMKYTALTYVEMVSYPHWWKSDSHIYLFMVNCKTQYYTEADFALAH